MVSIRGRWPWQLSSSQPTSGVKMKLLKSLSLEKFKWWILLFNIWHHLQVLMFWCCWTSIYVWNIIGEKRHVVRISVSMWQTSRCECNANANCLPSCLQCRLNLIDSLETAARLIPAQGSLSSSSCEVVLKRWSNQNESVSLTNQQQATMSLCQVWCVIPVKFQTFLSVALKICKWLWAL